MERGGPAPVKSVKLGLSQIEAPWGAGPPSSNLRCAEWQGPSNLWRASGPWAPRQSARDRSGPGPSNCQSRAVGSGPLSKWRFCPRPISVKPHGSCTDRDQNRMRDIEMITSVLPHVAWSIDCIHALVPSTFTHRSYKQGASPHRCVPRKPPSAYAAECLRRRPPPRRRRSQSYS